MTIAPAEVFAALGDPHRLEGAGLLRSHRTGRELLYVVRPDALARQARRLDDIAATWERRLAGVKAAEKDAG